MRLIKGEQEKSGRCKPYLGSGYVRKRSGDGEKLLFLNGIYFYKRYGNRLNHLIYSSAVRRRHD